MPLKTHHDEQPSLNLTPMIDIVFLLIIFFMVGTKFTELSEAERALPLNVPTVSDAPTLSEAPVKRMINVYRDGRITLDEAEVTETELESQLKQAIEEYPQIGVVIRGDAEGKFQPIASVLSLCARAGISDLGISVQLTDSQGNTTTIRQASQPREQR